MHVNTIIGTSVEEAAAYLRQGEVVAIPTETVYGLAANALSEDAVLKIYAAKNRPRFNPLIIHVANWQQALQYIQPAHYPEAEHLAAACWPGPLTLLLPANERIPSLVTAGSTHVALRVPNHPLTLELLRQLDFPLAAPSANPSGYVSPTTAQHVWDGLHGKIPYILDGGPCQVGLESTIVGWNAAGRAEVYRLGGISMERLAEILGTMPQVSTQLTENPKAPGQLKSHYAPHTPLYLGRVDEHLKAFAGKNVFLIRFRQYHPDVPEAKQLLLAPGGTVDEAAKNLFGILRRCDQLEADVVIAEELPHEGLGGAINDRLRRAQVQFKEAP
ncbi:MAG: L-threonylcarbamoyladenylate synthase [Lacibacter sp.]